MKYKILLIIILSALRYNLTAQPLNWREVLNDTAKPSTITKESVIKTEGACSIKYVFTDDGTPYYICDTFNVTEGSAFNFSIDYLDNDPQAVISARLWFFSPWGTTYLSRFQSTSTVDSADWQTITISGITPNTAVKAYIGIRMNIVTPDTFVSGTFYVDNCIYTEDSININLIKNPGFEEWPTPPIAPGSTLYNWTESLFDQSKTSIIENDTALKTEGLNSVKYTFTDPGIPYFLCDTFDVTAGSTYNFAIDYLDNDPQAQISARLWFFAPGGTTYLNRYTTGNTVDLPDWQTLTLTGTTPALAAKAFIGIRMVAKTPLAFVKGTFHADNCRYTEGSSATNRIINPGFEDWKAPGANPEFLTYKFAGLNPNVAGKINNAAHTVSLQVPYTTDVKALVATFTLNAGTAAKVDTLVQVSGTTPNNFTSPVTYTLTKGAITQDWVVSVSKPPSTTGKDILTFRFEGLSPVVSGFVNAAGKSVILEVPAGNDITALVPTITLSPNATVSPASGVVQNFTTPRTYTVTAQDGSTALWVVTVNVIPAGQTTIFYQDFEGLGKLPSNWIVINNDGYTQAAGEERWQDSAWVVSTSSYPEVAGSKLAVSSSFCSNMPLTGKADDWMILPAIALKGNSTLSWQAMSLTSSGNYPDDYKVYIAPAETGITPDVAYFEKNGDLLISVEPENWSTVAGNPGTGLSSRSVNLRNKITHGAPNGWFNRNVWIAFVLTTDRYINPVTGVPNATAGGSELAVDNIKVFDTSLVGITDNKPAALDVTVYPNPVRGEVVMNFDIQKTEMANIIITDVAGRVVMNLNINAVQGANWVKLNVSDLNKGVYLMRTLVENKINVTKLILQ